MKNFIMHRYRFYIIDIFKVNILYIFSFFFFAVVNIFANEHTTLNENRDTSCEVANLKLACPTPCNQCPNNDVTLNSVFLTMPDGQQIRVIVGGNPNSDKTVVFMHAHGLSGSVWHCYQTYLAQCGYFTLAIDLRGFGLSKPYIRGTELIDETVANNIARELFCAVATPPTCPPIPTQMWAQYGPTVVSDVYNIVQHFNIQKFSFIGWASGGHIANLFTFKYPSMVEKLVAFTPEYNLSAINNITPIAVPQYIFETALSYFIEFFPCDTFNPAIPGVITPSDIALYNQNPDVYFNFTDTTTGYFQNADTLATYDVIYAMLYYPIDGTPSPVDPSAPILNINQLTQPFFVILGADDTITPIQTEGFPFSQNLQNGRLLVYSRGDHFVPQMFANQAKFIIKDFLDGNVPPNLRQPVIIPSCIYPPSAMLPVQTPCPHFIPT